MLKYQVKIGLAPMRRDVTPRPGIFNWEKAEERGQEIVHYIKENFTDDLISFVDLTELNEVHTLFAETDVDKAAKIFTEANVDALVIINCNFGNEEAAAQLAKAVNKPTLLWAPLDDVFEADGSRYTDSQCGIFGVSRQFQRLNIPFSYIENSAVNSEVFAQGLSRFAAVACMVNNFTNLRVAQVGMRPKPFCSVIFNEDELMRKFGIQTIPVNLAVVIDKYNKILETEDASLEEGAKLLASRYEMDDLTPPLLKKVYAFVLLYEWIFKEYRVQAVSAECWTAMQLAVGAMPCTAYSILADMGYIISCESDMHGAITMLLLSCATMGRAVPFFGEFTVRHPENENGELLWHCGPFAYSLKKESSTAKNVNMRQWFEVKDGHYTISRFDQENGNYKLLAGEFDSIPGPYTFGTYLWAEFDDLSKWEKKLINGPYIHHMAEVSGSLTETLREFCRFVPNLELDTVE